jgi:hypothetical protein
MVEKLQVPSGLQSHSPVASSISQPLFPESKQSIAKTGSMQSKEANSLSHSNEFKAGFTFQLSEFNSGTFSQFSNHDPSSKFAFSSRTTASEDQTTMNNKIDKSTNGPRYFKHPKPLFPTKVNTELSSHLFEDYVKKIEKLERDNDKKYMKIVVLEAKESELEAKLHTLESKFEAKIAQLEKAIIALQTKSANPVDAPIHSPERNPIVKAVVENSDPKDDELKSIIAESQLLAKNADQLTKRLLNFQGNKDIATDDTSSVVTDTKPFQKSNSEPVRPTVVKAPAETASESVKNNGNRPVEEGVMKPQDETNLSRETGPNLPLQTSGLVSQNSTKSSEPLSNKASPKTAVKSSLSTDSNPVKPAIATPSKQVNTKSNQQICKEVTDCNQSNLSSSAITKPAKELEKIISISDSHASTKNNGTAGKVEIKPSKAPIVEKDSKGSDNKPSSNIVKKLNTPEVTAKTPLSLTKYNGVFGDSIFFTNTQAPNNAKTNTTTKATVLFTAAQRDDIVKLPRIDPDEREKVRDGKGFYKILLGTGGKDVMVYPKDCSEKLTSLYGKDSILSVMRNDTVISVCTRNESVFLDVFRWMKKLHPALFLLDGAFVDKPKMILMAVTTKDVKKIRTDVEDSILSNLENDPVILSHHNFGFVVLITLKTHKDYVDASKRDIYVEKNLCDKVEYRTQIEKAGWKICF